MISQQAICDLIPAVTRFTRAMVGDSATADDVVQDALAKALRSRHQYQQGTNPRAWLFSISRTVFIDHIRSAKRRGQMVDLDLVSDQVSVAPRQETPLHLRDFERSFRRLSFDHQQVLVLIGLEELSYEDAAATLEVSLGTVKSRLSRAREALRGEMSKAEHPRDRVA